MTSHEWVEKWLRVIQSQQCQVILSWRLLRPITTPNRRQHLLIYRFNCLPHTLLANQLCPISVNWIWVIQSGVRVQSESIKSAHSRGTLTKEVAWQKQRLIKSIDLKGLIGLCVCASVRTFFCSPHQRWWWRRAVNWLPRPAGRPPVRTHCRSSAPIVFIDQLINFSVATGSFRSLVRSPQPVQQSKQPNQEEKKISYRIHQSSDIRARAAFPASKIFITGRSRWNCPIIRPHQCTSNHLVSGPPLYYWNQSN